MVSASTVTSFDSMLARTDKLSTGSGYNIIRRSVVFLGWQRHVCPDYHISPVGDANKTSLQISLAAVLRLRFGSAVCKAIFLVADYFSLNVLICT